jgi:uncharacterized delta-60 repeat protein
MKNIFTLLFVLYSINGLTQICSPAFDQTFGTGGIAVGSSITGNNNGPNSNNILIQPDNKIIQVCKIFDGASRFAVIRYNANGTLDSSFGTNGRAITAVGVNDSYPSAGVLQPDGKIIVAGMANNANNADFALVRYNSNGSLDNSFGSGGIVMTPVGLQYDFASGLAIQPDGKIVVVGGSEDTSHVTAFATVRYNSNGSVDSTFGVNGKVVSHLGHFITFLGNVYYGVYSYENAAAVAIQPDGKIVVAGNSYTHSGCYDYYGGVYCNPAFAMTRYNSNGSLDNTFGNNGKVVDSVSLLYLASAVLQTDGKILVTGNSNNAPNKIITERYNSTGSLDNSFGTNGIVTTQIGSQNNYSYPTSIFYQPDGKILLAGNTSNNGPNDFVVIRYTTNGSPDNSFNNNGFAVFHIGQQGSYDGARGVALQGNNIVVAGTSNYFGASPATNNLRIAVIRLLDNASALSPVITPAGPVTFCQGTIVTLTSSQAGSVQWYNNNVLINGATSTTFNPLITGVYTVGVNNVNGCGVSAPVIVTVKNNPPKPFLTYDGNPYRFTTTAGYSGYQWYFNNVIIPGASGNTYTPAQAGLYKVQVTNADNCSNTSDPFNLVALGTSDITVGDTKLRFYPNPAQTEFYVDISQPSGKKIKVELYDLNGKLLQKQSLSQSHNEIAVHMLPAGIYQLVIYNNKEKAVRKIVVIK